MSSEKGKEKQPASTGSGGQAIKCSICKIEYKSTDDLIAHRNATHSLTKQQVRKNRNTNAEGNNKGVARNAGGGSSGSASGGGSSGSASGGGSSGSASGGGSSGSASGGGKGK